MKTVTMYGVMSLAALVFAGSALADQSIGNQNIAKRPGMGQPANETANQAWEGTGFQSSKQAGVIQVAEQKEQFRKQLNLQYASKRAYVKPDTNE